MRPAGLIAMGVELHVDGDNLVVRGAPDHLLPVIRDHKHRLIAELRGRVCEKCSHYWRHAGGGAGDCRLHDFDVLPLDDCHGWIGHE